VYAIIETGGKQYKVREGDTVDVELLDQQPGDIVELDRVLLVASHDDTTVGAPTVDGAFVRATVLDEVKGDKVVVFKYKPKVRYRRKTGHRQKYLRLQIDEISAPGIDRHEAEAVEKAEEDVPAAALPEVEALESTEALAEDTAPEETEESKTTETEESE
jgi:large subunit ribosomal protein L21